MNMAIRYKCRHCETEIGTLPFESAKETILLLQKMDEGEEERFLTCGTGRGIDGALHM